VVVLLEDSLKTPTNRKTYVQILLHLHHLIHLSILRDFQFPNHFHLQFHNVWCNEQRLFKNKQINESVLFIHFVVTFFLFFNSQYTSF